MKKVAIHQSQYLPWAPYFKKIAQVDTFVIMDNVQFQKNGVQNRNKIRDKNGDFWLTIPVSGNLEDTIVEKKISNPIWKKKHWKSIQSAYRNAPNWDMYSLELEGVFNKDYSTLFEVNDVILKFFLKALKLDVELVYMSELNTSSAKSELVLEICQKIHADIYVSGFGGKSYINEKSFTDASIAIEYLEANPPEYKQFHGDFISALSMLDMIMNVNETQINKYLNR